MQIIRRERPPVLLQEIGRGLARPLPREHMRLVRQAAALEQIAALAGRNDVLPAGAAAARTRDEMIEGELVRREAAAAVLAAEAVAQKNIEPGEGRPWRFRNELLERDDARQPHFERRAAHYLLVFRDDVDAVEEDGLHRFLPGPERQWEITQRPEVGIENQGGAAVRQSH